MQVTALGEAGKKVDWFFIYKVPQLAAGATDHSAVTAPLPREKSYHLAGGPAGAVSPAIRLLRLFDKSALSRT